MKRICLLVITLLSFNSFLFSQTDTDFWFVVPELSHRNNTGGTPGTLRISTLELEATVTISMPANVYDAATNPNGFQDIVLTIPANSASAVDLTHLIDTDALPNNNRLENKALTPDGINPYGLHITSTNMISVYWEVNYQYGSDLWTLKGSNGLGTLFYTPFQTVYPNVNILPARAYSAIDVVATEDNTRITFQLPAGKAASYGLNAANTIPAGGTYTSPPLQRGQTFSIYPFRFSTDPADRLAGTRVASTAPIAVTVKDDAILTPPSGQTTIGDQIVPVRIAGETYIVPEVQNPNHVFILATENNTNVEVFIADGTNILSTILNEGEQIMAQIPNGAKFARITSRVNTGDPFKPIYVWQMVGTGNQNRGGALVPPIGCTGNTQLAFTRAREGENGFYFYIITEKQNMDKFLVDGEKRDDLIPPVMGNRGFTELAGSGGWVAQITSSINANVLARGQHLVENTGGIFHLGIINGFPSAQRGALFYGYYSDFGGLNIGATVAGTNSSVVRTCCGAPVQLYAYGGTDYTWTPNTYLDDAHSNRPTAYNLPAGPHDYTVEVSGACGSGEIDLTIVVADSIDARFNTNVISGISPLEVSIEDISLGAIQWQYDLGDGSPLLRYDSITTNDQLGNAYSLPPYPFTFTNTYVNTTHQPIEYEITLLTKNFSACTDIFRRTITVLPEMQSGFSVEDTLGCHPFAINIHNESLNVDSYRWDFGDGSPVSTESSESLSHTYINTGSETAVYPLTLIAYFEDGHIDTLIQNITVHPEITANFITDVEVGCQPLEVYFSNLSMNADSYLWDFGDGVTRDEADPFHIYTNTGPEDSTYTAKLLAISQHNCRDSSMMDLVVHPFIQASFDSDSAACNLEEFVITDLSAGGDYYTWNFGDGTPPSSAQGPEISHIYRNLTQSPQVRTIQLTVTNEQGCFDQLSKDIKIYPSSKGGVLTGNTDPIIFGSSTGTISLSNQQGKVVKWQKIIKAGPWEDIPNTENWYDETPVSEGLWQYRVEVQNGTCPIALSELFNLMVLPKEVMISPSPDQGKTVGESDPVFTFTNSEWEDNSHFTGFLGREPGESLGEYSYTLGNLTAGPNYSLAIDSAPTLFTISAAVGMEPSQLSEELILQCMRNPFESFTILSYSLPEAGRISLQIRDMSGKLMKTLETGTWSNQGEYSLLINAEEFKSGMYLVSLFLDSGQNIRMKTIKLIKSN